MYIYPVVRDLYFVFENCRRIINRPVLTLFDQKGRKLEMSLTGPRPPRGFEPQLLEAYDYEKQLMVRQVHCS